MYLMYWKKQTTLLLIVMIFVATIFNFNCGKKTEPDQVVLAKVGDYVITADEFRYSYEFGLPHLKQGPNPKQSYLNYMIKEKLLALAGYQAGWDKSERVQQLENELTGELLVEQLFKNEVDDKIAVTTEEIKDAIIKSSVRWKLRYWVEPSLDYAGSVRAAMKKKGYGEVVDEILKNNPEIRMNMKDFETGYLTWLDVPPELLNAIKYLPVGEVSDPVEMNGAFFIFQLMDIRREPLSEYDIQNKTSSYKKILKAKKESKKAAEYVTNFMTPKNVVTKGDAFRGLSNALIEWHKTGKVDSVNFEQAVQSADDENSALFKLKKERNKTLVTFSGGKWSIQDFLDRFNEKAIKFEPSNENSYRNQVNQQIALKIRNHFFIQEARERDLQKATAVKKELIMWRDKWVYEEARNRFTQHLTIDDEVAKQYFSKYKDKYKTSRDEEPTFNQHATRVRRDALRQRALALLAQKVDSLKTYYPVSVNEAILDTISVTDFRQSKGINMQVFKRSSGRLARPIVDPSWIQ